MTSVVTFTEQQAVARNPVLPPPTRCSLTVMVLVVVRGVGVEVPQKRCLLEPSLISR